MVISDPKIVPLQMKFNILLAAVIVISAGGCTFSPDGENASNGIQKLPHFNSPDFTPEWPTNAADIAAGHKVEAFEFTNQNNEQVTNETFEGKIYVADFFFTSCGSICPKMTRNMATLQDAFMNDDDVMFISHSVTPEQDSVARLKEYAELMGVQDNKWSLVTGDKADIYNVARKSYFAEERMGFDRDVNAFLHTENFILVDKQGHIRGIYNGTLKVEMSRIVEDIRLLQKES